MCVSYKDYIFISVNPQEVVEASGKIFQWRNFYLNFCYFILVYNDGYMLKIVYSKVHRILCYCSIL